MGWSVNRPTGLTYHRTGLSTKGYTLFTPHGDQKTYLIGMDGQIVHTWMFDHIRPGYGRLLKNGHLLMTGSDINLKFPEPPGQGKSPPPFEERVKMLGGYHTTLLEVDWDGNKIAEYDNRFQHHDFFRRENGNTIVPIWVELSDEMTKKVRGGYKEYRERLPNLIGDEIIEVNADFEEVDRIRIWELMDPVKDPISRDVKRWEWTHVNGIDVNERGDIVFSARHNDRVAIIDAETRDIRWKYTKTHGQHNPTWVGDGNIQIFDNGHAGSRVIEVNPENDEVVWEFHGSPYPQFFSGHISGASRIPGGNVLVCEGTSGRLFEVTRNKETVWEWINPFVNMTRGNPTTSIYRAHRYSPDHPALAGRDLDPERYGNLNRLNNLDKPAS
ncbi:MAG: aryl-sulfate sulfotransferase [Pseudomonadota bacterium]|nr:aryl-sulfate sulfotransferase [Pseudomonadota bacterium]